MTYIFIPNVDQGVGDQGVGDQGVGGQGVGDQRLGYQGVGDEGVGDQRVEGTIMSSMPLYPVHSKKVKTLTVPGKASFSPPGQVISITFHCNRRNKYYVCSFFVWFYVEYFE